MEMVSVIAPKSVSAIMDLEEPTVPKVILHSIFHCLQRSLLIIDICYCYLDIRYIHICLPPFSICFSLYLFLYLNLLSYIQPSVRTIALRVLAMELAKQTTPANVIPHTMDMTALIVTRLSVLPAPKTIVPDLRY